jgi:ribonuclease D
MSENRISPPLWINQPDNFKSMVADLSQQKSIAVDTESNSLYAYEEKICLIQFSTTSTDYLVDPLASVDISPLGLIFSNIQIEKIFHAAEYDIMCLKRDFDFSFNNIFDTMIASRTLGRTQVGLSSLLMEFFNFSADKKYQRADWGKRPIQADMLRYAQMDTHFLIKIRNILEAELIDNQLLELAHEDFQRTCRVEAFQSNKNGDQYWKLLKGRHIPAQNASVLFMLYETREELAKKANIPPFKIISNISLVETAVNLPQTKEDLGSITGLSPKLIERYGSKLLSAIEKGLSTNPLYRKNKQKPAEDYIMRYEKLKGWRKKIAESLKVESDVILPKEYLDLLAQDSVLTPEKIKSLMHDIPYRYNRFGSEIIKLLNE